MPGGVESIFQTDKCLINRKPEKIPLGNFFCKEEFYSLSMDNKEAHSVNTKDF